MSGKSKYYTERIISEGQMAGVKFEIVTPGILAVLRVVKLAIAGKTQYDINTTCLSLFVRIDGRQKSENWFLEMNGVDYLMLVKEVKKAMEILKQKRSDNYRQLLQKLQK
jgi:hypothetical protein